MKRHHQRNRFVLQRLNADRRTGPGEWPPYDGPRFLYIDKDEEAPAGAISIDGLARGAALHLSHWRDNETPEQWKADTSTEIALNFVQSEEAERWKARPIVNQHFDTDGVLSAWALMNPDAAVKAKSLLIAAAEAGDFGEWPADERGLWLNEAILSFEDASGDHRESYARAFRFLPELIETIAERRDLWGPLDQALREAKAAVNDGRIAAETRGGLGIIVRSAGAPAAPDPLITRLLKGRWRYLLADETEDGRFSYRYILPFHAWADTVVRAKIPAPDTGAILDALGPPWESDHLSGLTAIAGTAEPVATSLDEVVAALERADPELRAGSGGKLNRY